jgi:LPXTG-motif cell wall-anchored protein
VVFSEIYYPKGWNAYINGEELPHFRVNYVLRGMVLPKGENTITFEFKPTSYYTGKSIASISSIVVIILILGVIVYMYIKRRKKEKVKEKINK